MLTYNSASELPMCLNSILLQEYIDLRLIIVDNASQQEECLEMETLFNERVPDGEVHLTDETIGEQISNIPALFIRNKHNMGYSVGNNIGARLAVEMGCEAVLIINPDVRIQDPSYIVTLYDNMRAEPKCAVGASRILNLDGTDAHPIREVGFWEELLWIRQIGPSMFRPKSYVQSPKSNAPIDVEKLHGCCMMISTSFLKQISYLDEKVFLYCEEPILASRMRAVGGRLILFPQIIAIHAHISSTKGNASRRMQQFIRSRLYYLDRYSGYGPFALCALQLSYRLLSILHAVRALLSKA